MRAADFPIVVIVSPEVNCLKVHLGVLWDLASCHTAEVGGSVIGRHVPAEAVRRLLSAKPQAKGLAVPEMPVASPGMEVEGLEDDTCDVVLFGSSGQMTFARYRGAQRL